MRMATRSRHASSMAVDESELPVRSKKIKLTPAATIAKRASGAAGAEGELFRHVPFLKTEHALKY
jgi:hypothetical protein